MQNHINTIFFDLFGVLLGIDQSVVVQYLSKLTNTSYLKTREITMGEPYMQLERGEVTFKEYVEDISAMLPNGNRIDANSLREIWMNSRVGEMPAVSLLDDLFINYEVWIISNTTESHINSLKSKFTFLKNDKRATFCSPFFYVVLQYEDIFDNNWNDCISFCWNCHQNINKEKRRILWYLCK